ncbi:MAG: hypothetical protein GY928_01125 [Colwellia sp.]|nr:hypothetical protein [Colwellia sp.]
MATKGDVSDLEVLQYGGSPLVPLVQGFNRTRRSGVIQSEVAGGMTRQRKKYFNMPHVSNVVFYLKSAMMQDYLQSFINLNEGKKFICHLSADRPIVEPYVVQAIGDWNHVEVNAIKGTVTCEFEIISTKVEVLDEFLQANYASSGDDIYSVILGYPEIVELMPTP